MIKFKRIKLFSVFPLLILSTLPFHVEAEKLSDRECAEVASYINQNNSRIVIDEITTLINTACILGEFTYNYEISEYVTPGDFKSLVFSQLKKRAILQFCSDPATRDFLDSIQSVTFKYFRFDGVYLTEYSFNEFDC
jgi:hypothetical protein